MYNISMKRNPKDPNINQNKTFNCLTCGELEYERRNTVNKYCSNSCNPICLKGRIFSEETKRKMSVNSKGIRKSPKTEFKKGVRVSPATEFGKGTDNANWNNGSSFLRQSYGNSKYMAWRKEVVERDGNVCQVCLEETDKIETDHIKPWAIYPELRFEVANGQVICRPCHLLKSVEDRRIIALTKGN